MAVEARHMNLFSPQLIANGDFIKSNQGNASIYSSAQMEYGNGLPFPATMPESLVPPPLLYQSQSFDCNLASAKTSMNKADSELTYYVPSQRKRSRDSINDEFNGYTVAPQKMTNKLSGFPSFLHQDIAFQVQQQQSEIDRFLAQHAEKVRLELEEQRKRQSRILVSAIQEGIVKKLQEKDEVIQRMGKLNWVLQERVKSLCMENQIWRDLAQANEATANSLRSNLQQVLAHVSDDHRDMGEGGGAATKAAAAVADDAESSCGSSDFGRCTLANEAEEGEGVKDKAEEGVQDKTMAVVGNGNRMCRKCGGRESRVLLLPCRHLCLCTLCGSTLRNCPLCHSLINASVHVNLS